MAIAGGFGGSIVWTCEACAARLQLDTKGQASAPAGYCGAGAHHVRQVVRWAPGAGDVALETVQPQPPEPIADKFGQLGLF
jgi:hypothetical protein